MVIQLHTSLTALIALILWSLCSLAQAQVIKQFPLDTRTVYAIPVGVDTPTTIMFPSALTAIEGANVSARPETPAPVLLSYTSGRNFFSVRAAEPNARAAINVIWKNQTYVIRFMTGPEPFGSVTFFEDDFGLRGGAAHRRVGAETLIGMLDRAKNFSLIASQYPQAVQQIEKTTPNSVTLYKDFRVTLEEVFRFDPEDTLVFRLKFENSTDKEIYYQPQRLAARVGSNVYYASVCDASGILPPKATTVAYFAITSTPRGARANLSVNNLFSIIVTRIERDAKLIIPR